MHISAKSDYAVRAAIELAGAGRGPIKCVAIAKAQSIPVQFLNGILADLRNNQIVESQRGVDGGYWLSRDPATISVAEVIRAVDGPLLLVRGKRASDVVYNDAAATLQPVWVSVRARLREILESVSIADLFNHSLPEFVQQIADDPATWLSH
jgi:Rrf2 family protein